MNTANLTIAPPKEIVDIAENAMTSKASTPLSKSFVLAIAAGAYIAFGFVFYTTTQVGAAAIPTGVAKLLGGMAFSVGLIMVVMTGADLFTSTTMSLMAKAGGKITWGRLFSHWVVVWVGNFVGSLLIVFICYFGNLQGNMKGQWGAVVTATATAKLSHAPLQNFVLGIGCNLLVCLAVWMAFAGKTVADKVLGIVGPIALFVASGFEHSVANMFMLPYGLLLDYGHGPLTIANLFLVNLIPVTLGNIVGGGIMHGMVYWWVHKK
ncbi:MAG: formate/nitrite family transporter [Actinomycetaceae bacterium]|nr:formate/nitrite family transporter [Actinomycetaceae bacterium]